MKLLERPDADRLDCQFLCVRAVAAIDVQLMLLDADRDGELEVFAPTSKPPPKRALS
jgi:hypothetical protein